MRVSASDGVGGFSVFVESGGVFAVGTPFRTFLSLQLFSMAESSRLSRSAQRPVASPAYRYDRTIRTEAPYHQATVKVLPAPCRCLTKLQRFDPLRPNAPLKP